MTARATRLPVRPIRNEADHRSATARIEALMSARPGTPEFDELEVLGTLVDVYEREHHPIDPPDPVDAIEFRMEQGEFTRADLARLLGGSARVTEVLKRRRHLSLAMIARLHEELGIPLESLVHTVTRGGPRKARQPQPSAAPLRARRAHASRTRR
jgi:HTH-type transcriptional regulator / antitoxin HigA